MKKICFVTTIPSTFKSFFLKTAECIHEKTNWDISFISSYDSNIEELLPDYIHYHPIPMKRGVSIGGISALFKMYRVFKKEKFNMIQYSTPNAAFYASIAAKLAGIKVRNYHLMGFRYANSTGIKRIILKAFDKVACMLSTHVECVSRSNLELGVKDKVFSREKATVVWNGSTGGVDLGRFDHSKKALWRPAVRRELNLTEDDYVYAFFGRITRDKGINELLEAYFALDTKDKLLIVGNVEGEQFLDQGLLERARNCANVIFHPRVSDIERYFAAVDVLILPSYREGFGNVIIEAAAMGVPAIISDIPGPIDAVEIGKTALAVSVKDSESLRQAMSRIKAMDATVCENSCVEFVKNNFDSEELNKRIVERKALLLKER